MQNIPIDLRDLAHDRNSIAALAAHLVSDVHGGEDLAQESVYRLLRAGQPRPHGTRLAWLRTTVRRLAANEYRGRRSRQHREQEAARPEAVLSSDQIAERAELCQRIHRAIDSLSREQASLLRDHYFGGLAATEIAGRDGISISNVKSRIHRARAALRGALERDGLDGDVHWSIALAPLVPLGTSAPAGAGLSSTLNGVAGAALIMKKVVSVAMLLVALVVGLQFILSDGAREVTPSSSEVVSRDLTLPSGRVGHPDLLDPEDPYDGPLGRDRTAVRGAILGGDDAPQVAGIDETPFPVDGRHIDPRDFESAEELLSFHWGSHWPEVRAELLAAGASIDDYPIDEMPTWAELQPNLLDHIGEGINERMEAASASAATWENPLTAMGAFAGKSGVALPPEARIADGMWDEISGLNDLISSATVTQISGLHVALLGSLQQPGIATVHPIVFPHFTLETPARAITDHAWLRSVAMDGWAIDWSLDATSVPEFAIWRQELAELHMRRNALMTEALSPWLQ